MFRHQGKARTLKHNLQIASLLSFVAGIVNVVGFLSLQVLTTNVTGHFAFFLEEVFNLDWLTALVFFTYIFFFFAGSFISNLVIEIVARRSERYIYIIPASIESTILLFLALFGRRLLESDPNVIICSLLFAMGLQNSFVTTISNATVRTTHLTGLFTDLGIELSQLFFYKLPDQKDRLISLIKLRLIIIGFFFGGGIFGGIIYTNFGLHALAFAGLLLIGGLIFDSIKLRILLLRRRYKKI